MTPEECFFEYPIGEGWERMQATKHFVHQEVQQMSFHGLPVQSTGYEQPTEIKNLSSNLDGKGVFDKSLTLCRHVRHWVAWSIEGPAQPTMILEMALAS